jgi:hypothetical protein
MEYDNTINLSIIEQKNIIKKYEKIIGFVAKKYTHIFNWIFEYDELFSVGCDILLKYYDPEKTHTNYYLTIIKNRMVDYIRNYIGRDYNKKSKILYKTYATSSNKLINIVDKDLTHNLKLYSSNKLEDDIISNQAIDIIKKSVKYFASPKKNDIIMNWLNGIKHKENAMIYNCTNHYISQVICLFKEFIKNKKDRNYINRRVFITAWEYKHKTSDKTFSDCMKTAWKDVKIEISILEEVSILFKTIN